MTTFEMISLYAMTCLYLFTGVCHFLYPKVFIKITPSWVPCPKATNIIVGFIEITLGFLLLIPVVRSYAALAIICLLIAIFPANVKHYFQEKQKNRYVLATMLRLPVQLLLIYWAYTFI